MSSGGVRWFDELPEQELFGEGHALELQQLHVLLHASIEREADLPRTREDVRIFDGRLVHQVERTRRGVALDDMRASSFGNHFAKLSSHQLERVLSALEQELALYRDGDVFRLQRYLLYALADRDDF